MMDEHEALGAPAVATAPGPTCADDTGQPAGGTVSRLRALLLSRAEWIALGGVLLLVAVVIARGISKGEFNLGVDEAHHAFTGLFAADFLRDLPLLHPVRYTYLYYARYPVLGIIHWPPLFYLVEGIVFLTLGPSVVTARLTVMLFALLGLYFWFKLVRELDNTGAALASTAILGVTPWLLLYEKAVMLEVPTMALCITASYLWIRYLRGGASRSLYQFAVVASLALLTKEQSIYLAPFCLFTALAQKKWYLIWDRRIVKALGLVLALTLPFYSVVVTTYYDSILWVLYTGNSGTAHSWSYYWSVIPHQLGWPLLVCAIAGAATSRWWGRWETSSIMLMWILACYAVGVCFALKEARYVIYWFPPLIYFAVAPFTSRALRPRLRMAAVVILLVMVGSEVRAGWAYQRPYISGYAAVARRLTGEGQPGLVLDDEALSADFCFYVRADNPQRRFIVMRKALYVENEDKQTGAIEFVHDRAQVDQLIRRYGIRYALVDNGPLDFNVQQVLRDFLRTPQFRLIGVFPISSNIPSWQGRKLFLYENTEVTQPTAKWLRLKMLTLGGRDIVVSMHDLLEGSK